VSNDSILGQYVWRTYVRLEIREMILPWNTMVKNNKNDPLACNRSHNLINARKMLKQYIEVHKDLRNISSTILLQEDSIQYDKKTDSVIYRIIITKKNGGIKDEKNCNSNAN